MGRPHQHHHTVPVGYLRAFATQTGRRPRIEVLDFRTGAWRRQRPEAVFERKGFYSVALEALENAVETQVLGRLEDRALPLIRRLHRRIPESVKRGRKRGPLEREEIELQALFVSMTYVRSELVRRSADRTRDDP
jgi:hypothetical protein